MEKGKYSCLIFEVLQKKWSSQNNQDYSYRKNGEVSYTER
jgi:hypothetical protein